MVELLCFTQTRLAECRAGASKIDCIARRSDHRLTGSDHARKIVAGASLHVARTLLSGDKILWMDQVGQSTRIMFSKSL